MDPIMQALFGNMPIAQLQSVQQAVEQKNNTQTIVIMGVIIVVTGIIACNIYLQSQELKIKLKTAELKNKKIMSSPV